MPYVCSTLNYKSKMFYFKRIFENKKDTSKLILFQLDLVTNTETEMEYVINQGEMQLHAQFSKPFETEVGDMDLEAYIDSQHVILQEYQTNIEGTK